MKSLNHTTNFVTLDQYEGSAIKKSYESEPLAKLEGENLEKSAHARHKYLTVKGDGKKKRYVYDHSKMNASEHRNAQYFHENEHRKAQQVANITGAKEDKELVAHHSQLASEHEKHASQKSYEEGVHNTELDKLISEAGKHLADGGEMSHEKVKNAQKAWSEKGYSDKKFNEALETSKQAWKKEPITKSEAFDILEVDNLDKKIEKAQKSQNAQSQSTTPRTKSGKVIDTSGLQANHKFFNDYSKEDHHDAAEYHSNKANGYAKKKDYDNYMKESRVANSHVEQYQKKEKEESK